MGWISGRSSRFVVSYSCQTNENYRYELYTNPTEISSGYGKYPRYPLADAGYGSFNNYLYCELRNMEKYMNFTMYEKESKDSKHPAIQAHIGELYDEIQRLE